MKRVICFLTNMVVWGAFLLFGFHAIIALDGIKCYTVISGSMAPAIPVGSAVYIKKMEFADIREGDVITYFVRKGGITVTHRVLEIDRKTRSITTKGDANAQKDAGSVQEEQIEGIMLWRIPLLGYVNSFLLNRRCGSMILLLAALKEWRYQDR